MSLSDVDKSTYEELLVEYGRSIKGTPLFSGGSSAALMFICKKYLGINPDPELEYRPFLDFTRDYINAVIKVLFVKKKTTFKHSSEIAAVVERIVGSDLYFKDESKEGVYIAKKRKESEEKENLRKLWGSIEFFVISYSSSVACEELYTKNLGKKIHSSVYFTGERLTVGEYCVVGLHYFSDGRPAPAYMNKLEKITITSSDVLIKVTGTKNNVRLVAKGSIFHQLTWQELELVHAAPFILKGYNEDIPEG